MKLAKMNKRMKIYYASPITGAWGNDAPLSYIRQNCDIALRNVRWLREVFPCIDWYSPAENDTLVQILFVAGRLKREDIMWGNKQILEGCEGLLAHCWETSEGIKEEITFCKQKDIPVLEIEKIEIAYDAIKDFCDKLAEVIKETVR